MVHRSKSGHRFTKVLLTPFMVDGRALVTFLVTGKPLLRPIERLDIIVWFVIIIIRDQM
jgi:hypothetical protein